MQTQEFRLECLKLAQRPGLSPYEVIAAAREYLAWVSGVPEPITSEKKPADSPKAGKLAPNKLSDKPFEQHRLKT